MSAMFGRTATAAALVLTLAGNAAPPQHFTYLLPAPKEAIVFAPLLLAEADGGFARKGLSVRFEKVAGGGAKVGEALGSGKGDAGGALGDTALLLRAHGVPVRGVALLGRHSFLTLITTHGLPLDAAGLRGKSVGVPAIQDVSYYALKALLRRAGLTEADVTVRAASPAELIDALGKGTLQAIIGTVDWGVKAERAGIALDYRSLDSFYPALAQGVMASDAVIATRGAALRQFDRAVLTEIAHITRSPDAAARQYVAVAPASGFTQAEVARVFRLLGRHVYGKAPGRFAPKRMESAASAAVSEGLVPTGTHAAGSYTNLFNRR